MRQIKAPEDIYPAIDEMIAELKAIGQLQMAATLHHPMYKVAWTSRSELLDDLQSVLIEALKLDGGRLPKQLQQQIFHIISALAAEPDRYL